MFKRSDIRQLFSALRGKNPGSDRESFKLALAENIIGQLKDNDFIVKANKMVVGCESTYFKEVIEEAKPLILTQLKNQGGSMYSLAKRIDREDGIMVCISKAPEGVDVKKITTEDLTIEVWFYLEKVKVADTRLTISRKNWKVELDPQKRYTLGRSAESRDTTIMLTIPDASNSISRWQAEIVCIEGVWYCKAISEKCQTFIDDRFAEGDVLYPLENLKKGGQIRLGMGSPGFILHYSISNY